MLLHEGATPLLDTDQPARLQRLHGAAQRVAVHLELVRELLFRRQPVARLEAALGDIPRHGFLDLAP